MENKKERIEVIKCPMKWGQGKNGVNEAPKILEELGIKEIFNKNNINYNTNTLKEIKESNISLPHLRFIDNVKEINKELFEISYSILKQNKFPLVIGGDHSLAIGSLAATCKDLNKNIGIIWFDAHPDLNKPEESPSGNIHGMPLAFSIGLCDNNTGLSEIGDYTEKLEFNKLVYVGIRSIDPCEERLIKEHNIKNFKPEDVKRIGMENVMKDILEYLKDCDYIHLSFDIDGMDSKLVPGTGTPVENGCTEEDAHILLKELAKCGKLRSTDIVEYNPEIEKEITGKRTLRCIDTLISNLK